VLVDSMDGQITLLHAETAAIAENPDEDTAGKTG
jgi:hypothetical protein